MGVGLYFKALLRPVAPRAPQRVQVKAQLRESGLRLGWRGLVTACRRLPLEQYQGLLSLLKAVHRDVRIEFTVTLPPLTVMLGDQKNPPIDFRALTSPEHVAQIVTDYFDYREQNLHLEFLPSYLRKVRLDQSQA